MNNDEIWVAAYLAAIISGADRDTTCTRAYQAVDDWLDYEANKDLKDLDDAEVDPWDDI